MGNFTACEFPRSSTLSRSHSERPGARPDQGHSAPHLTPPACFSCVDDKPVLDFSPRFTFCGSGSIEGREVCSLQIKGGDNPPGTHALHGIELKICCQLLNIACSNSTALIQQFILADGDGFFVPVSFHSSFGGYFPIYMFG